MVPLGGLPGSNTVSFSGACLAIGQEIVMTQI
jgi:hypothetical protein